MPPRHQGCVKHKIKYYLHFGSSDNVIANKSDVHETEATNLLSQYLSKLTFTDDDGLRLPDEELPEGFLFNHRRCSRRTLYSLRPGFTMIVSKEQSWSSDCKEEDRRETVRNVFLNICFLLLLSVNREFNYILFEKEQQLQLITVYFFVLRRISTCIVKSGTKLLVKRTGNRKRS